MCYVGHGLFIHNERNTMNYKMNSSLRVIAPFRYEGMWVFDDPDIGLDKEPFVEGSDTMLDWLARDIADAGTGFLLSFAPAPFPGYQEVIHWMEEEYCSHWYCLEEPQIRSCLGSVLLKYFDPAPDELYIMAEAKRE